MENYNIYWADALTNEDLIMQLIADNNNSLIFEELIRRMKPVIFGEALAYRTQLPLDSDDYLQEGRIVLWKIAAKGTFKPGNFRNFFISAIRFHLRHLYRDYVLKNLVCIGGYEDCRGQTYQILIEAPFAARFREKHRIHCRADILFRLQIAVEDLFHGDFIKFQNPHHVPLTSASFPRSVSMASRLNW